MSNPTSVVTERRLGAFYQEILPYLGGSADAGFTPVGSVIAIMGVTAPANYLACNGQIVNVADYPELANYFEQQFGTKYKFGGSGTTFGIPDLRGEFLRGTGTNSHANQGNGAAVGVHQDATIIPHFQVNVKDSTTNNVYFGTDATTRGVGNADKNIMSATGGYADYSFNRDSQINRTGSQAVQHTTRPTNTSVLFCIATKDIYLNPAMDYSTSEKVVGKWIDGSTLYQKTVEVTITDPATNLYSIGQTEKTPAQLGISGTISVKYIEGVNDNGAPINRTWGISFSNTDPKYCSQIYFQHVLFNDSSQSLIIQTNRTGNGKVYITLRYTKTT